MNVPFDSFVIDSVILTNQLCSNFFTNVMYCKGYLTRANQRTNCPIIVSLFDSTDRSVDTGKNPGGWIGWLATRSLGRYAGNKTNTEAILSPIVPISICQVSHPPQKSPLDPPP